MSNTVDDLYRDYILEHYKRPRNFGELEPHDLEALEHNPLCGDELGVHIRVKDERIEDLRFHGHACEIAQPWPWKRRSSMRSSLTRMCTPSSSPHRGLCSSASRSWGSSAPKLRGRL